VPIETVGSAGGAIEIPAGTQAEFAVKAAAFDEKGKYGPAVELDLNFVTEQYYGVPLKYWARVQQPRLDLVRKWRGDGMSDNLIKEALKERGFKFKKIDEPDKMVVGKGGNLYKILVAGTGSPRAADALLAEVDSFDELAERMANFRFIGTTKKSADGQYVQLDGKEEITPQRGRRRRRPLRPSDRAYLESRCSRCGGSKIGVEAPTDSRTNLCFCR
jgi:hypothetical protein